MEKLPCTKMRLILTMQDRQNPLLGMGVFVCLQHVKWFWTQTPDFHWEPKRN